MTSRRSMLPQPNCVDNVLLICVCVYNMFTELFAHCTSNIFAHSRTGSFTETQIAVFARSILAYIRVRIAHWAPLAPEPCSLLSQKKWPRTSRSAERPRCAKTRCSVISLQPACPAPRKEAKRRNGIRGRVAGVGKSSSYRPRGVVIYQIDVSRCIAIHYTSDVS